MKVPKRAIMKERVKYFRRLFFYLIPTEVGRTKYLKKHNILREIGENVRYQPRVYPSDAKFLKIHNNVCIARAVNFIMHDIMCLMFDVMDNENKYGQHKGCIEIMDNVFIGSGAQICPNVKIGPNAIVAAGAIVTKDVPAGTVVGGCPAKIIGDFESVRKLQLEESYTILDMSVEERIDYEWKLFEKQRKIGDNQ